VETKDTSQCFEGTEDGLLEGEPVKPTPVGRVVSTPVGQLVLVGEPVDLETVGEPFGGGALPVSSSPVGEVVDSDVGTTTGLRVTVPVTL
jgi:hypothetical protein